MIDIYQTKTKLFSSVTPSTSIFIKRVWCMFGCVTYLNQLHEMMTCCENAIISASEACSILPDPAATSASFFIDTQSNCILASTNMTSTATAMTDISSVQKSSATRAAAKRKACGEANSPQETPAEKKQRRDITAVSQSRAKKLEWLGHLRALTRGKKQSTPLRKFLDFRKIESHLFDVFGTGTLLFASNPEIADGRS